MLIVHAPERDGEMMKTAPTSSDIGLPETRIEKMSPPTGLAADPRHVDVFRRLTGEDDSDDRDRRDRDKDTDDDTMTSDALSLADISADSSSSHDSPSQNPNSGGNFQAPTGKREDAAPAEEDDIDRSTDAVGSNDEQHLEVGMVTHHIQQDSRSTAEASATAREIRVERQAAVAELTQMLEASAVSLLAPEDGVHHDRVDLMLSMPPLEGVTVGLFTEEGRLVVEFAATGDAAHWLAEHARGMSEQLSTRLQRPVLTRIQTDRTQSDQGQTGRADADNDQAGDVEALSAPGGESGRDTHRVSKSGRNRS
jgi:hypothetical protein